MTIKYKFGVVDNSCISLRGPRPIDVVCETLAEAFAEAADLIYYSAKRVSIVRCKLNRSGDDWVDAGGEEIDIDARYVEWINDCTDDEDDEAQVAGSPA